MATERIPFFDKGIHFVLGKLFIYYHSNCYKKIADILTWKLHKKQICATTSHLLIIYYYKIIFTLCKNTLCLMTHNFVAIVRQSTMYLNSIQVDNFFSTFFIAKKLVRLLTYNIISTRWWYGKSFYTPHWIISSGRNIIYKKHNMNMM